MNEDENDVKGTPTISSVPQIALEEELQETGNPLTLSLYLIAGLRGLTQFKDHLL